MSAQYCWVMLSTVLLKNFQLHDEHYTNYHLANLCLHLLLFSTQNVYFTRSHSPIANIAAEVTAINNLKNMETTLLRIQLQQL